MMKRLKKTETVEEKAEPRQQSVPAFSEQEMTLVQLAMKVEAIPVQGQWVKRAAIMWARQIVVSDHAKLDAACRELIDELNQSQAKAK